MHTNAEEEGTMHVNDLMICGALWTCQADADAGRKLIRALDSSDADVRMCARMLLESGGSRSKQLIGEAIFEGELSTLQAVLAIVPGAAESTMNFSAAGDWLQPMAEA